MADTWRVLGIEVGITEPETALRSRALEAAGIGASELRGFRIARKSLDARRVRGERKLRFVIHADLLVDPGFRSAALARAERAGRVARAPEPGRLEVERVHRSLAGRRVAVLGAGPAGLFAALTLARNGVAVDLVDRGAVLRERGRDLAAFQRSRVPDPESNLLFGEGGAGTYSDGKLYTRVESPLELPILDELVTCGAPGEIRFDARAHVGTDRLHRILPRLRARPARGGGRALPLEDARRRAAYGAGRARPRRRARHRARRDPLRRARLRARPQRARYLARARRPGPAARGEAVPARRADRAPAGADRSRPPWRRA